MDSLCHFQVAFSSLMPDPGKIRKTPSTKGLKTSIELIFLENTLKQSFFGQNWSNKVSQSLFRMKKSVFDHYFGHRNITSGHFELFYPLESWFCPQKRSRQYYNFWHFWGQNWSQSGLKVLKISRSNASLSKIMLKHTLPNWKKTLWFFVW